MALYTKVKQTATKSKNPEQYTCPLVENPDASVVYYMEISSSKKGRLAFRPAVRDLDTLEDRSVSAWISKSDEFDDILGRPAQSIVSSNEQTSVLNPLYANTLRDTTYYLWWRVADGDRNSIRVTSSAIHWDTSIRYTAEEQTPNITVDTYRCDEVTRARADKLYYMKMTALVDGSIKFSPLAFHTYTSIDIPVWISTSEQFDPVQGRPRSFIASSISASTSNPLYVNTTSNTIYYLWWRVPDNFASVEIRVTSQAVRADTPIWTVNLHTEPRGVLRSKFTERYTQQPYSIEEYIVTIPSPGGTVRVHSGSSNNVVYIIKGSFTINKQTGEPSRYDSRGTQSTTCDVSATSSSSRLSFTVLVRRASWADPVVQNNVTINIIPPGAEWETSQFDDETTIGRSGALWEVVGNQFLRKVVNYIPIRASGPGTFRFSSSGSETLYGYLTESPLIDENGFPTERVLGSDEPSSGGFSFEATITTASTFYFMFRTDDGELPSSLSSFIDLKIEYLESAALWTVDNYNIGTNRTTSYSRYIVYPTSTDTYTLLRFKGSFQKSGLVVFYSKEPTSGSANTAYPMGWITNDVDTFDRTNGTPPSSAVILAQDNGGGTRQIRMEAVVSAGVTYNFWIRLVDGSLSGKSGYVFIDPPGASVEWQNDDRTYDTSLTNLSIDVYDKPYHITAVHNAKYAMSFAGSGTFKLSTAGSTPVSGYIGTSDTGFDSQSGIPLSYSNSSVGNPNFTITMNVTAGTTYYLWFKGNDETIDGDITFTLEVPPPSSAEWRSSDRSSIINPSGTATDMISMTAGYVYKTLIRFASSGEVSFYSETTSGPGKLVGYLTEADGGIDPSTGVPYGTIVASDDSGDGEFEFNHNVHAGRSYYLWVRATSITAYGVITEIIKMISAVSDRGFWIWADTGDWYKWHYLTSYLYTDRWRQVKAYAATSTGWIDEY